MQTTSDVQAADTNLKLPKLLDQVPERLRVKHYAYRTEQTYLTGLNDTSSTLTSVIPNPSVIRRRLGHRCVSLCGVVQIKTGWHAIPFSLMRMPINAARCSNPSGIHPQHERI